jgi:hypothetical protein
MLAKQLANEAEYIAAQNPVAVSTPVVETASTPVDTGGGGATTPATVAPFVDR